ncbi:hypothetical protein PWT90_03752 [Aphanocladium album]|nr:hypothetical protein PWT90_03752 [Aphanocladium album]
MTDPQPSAARVRDQERQPMGSLTISQDHVLSATKFEHISVDDPIRKQIQIAVKEQALYQREEMRKIFMLPHLDLTAPNFTGPLMPCPPDGPAYNDGRRRKAKAGAPKPWERVMSHAEFMRQYGEIINTNLDATASKASIVPYFNRVLNPDATLSGDESTSEASSRSTSTNTNIGHTAAKTTSAASKQKGSTANAGQDTAKTASATPTSKDNRVKPSQAATRTAARTTLTASKLKGNTNNTDTGRPAANTRSAAPSPEGNQRSETPMSNRLGRSAFRRPTRLPQRNLFIPN